MRGDHGPDYCKLQWQQAKAWERRYVETQGRCLDQSCGTDLVPEFNSELVGW